MLSDYVRGIIDNLICSSFESKHGIITTTERAMGNPAEINVERTAVLRQFFGKSYSTSSSENNTTTVNRATYTHGSVSVGIDPHNFVTRDMTMEMHQISQHLIKLLRSNIALLNVEGVNLDNDFNHCTVLLYYADGTIKDEASIGFHCDSSYSARDCSYETDQNSQVENTPVVTYSMGDTRNLKWLRRISKKFRR